MIAAILHISVATHYCEGKEIALKVSFTGKLASCGMEGSENELPFSGTYFAKHCCEDIVTVCGIDNNYTPSFSFIPTSFHYIFSILSISEGFTINPPQVLKSQYTNISPPGVLMSTNVDLSGICVFRI